MKKRSESMSDNAVSSRETFLFEGENEAFCVVSNRFIKRESIFCPKPKRSHLGKLR